MPAAFSWKSIASRALGSARGEPTITSTASITCWVTAWLKVRLWLCTAATPACHLLYLFKICGK